jgi:GTP-binding protein
MAKQAEQAIAEADALLFMVDARSGLTPHDEQIATRLRRAGRPTFLVVNKGRRHEPLDDRCRVP